MATNAVWTPLESNPDVMKDYADSLGLKVDKLQFSDVMSTEEWALDMVPRPVYAVIMVYPIKDITEARRAEQKEKILKDGQIVSDKVYYMKQTVPNACGTIAILHAIGNLGPSKFAEVVKPGSFVERFFKDTKEEVMTPESIASYLENDEDIDALHAEASHKGQSEVPDEGEETINHFVCFR